MQSQFSDTGNSTAGDTETEGTYAASQVSLYIKFVIILFLCHYSLEAPRTAWSVARITD